MKKKISIFRTKISPYQRTNFGEKEKKAIENLSNNEFTLNYGHTSPVGPSIIITNTLTNISELSGINFKNIELLIHPNSGYDNFSHDFVKEASFPIIIGNPIRAHAVANYILSCLFRHFTPLQIHKNWHPKRDWQRSNILSQKNVLIIGFGHIGKILHNTLKPLCKKVSIYDPFKGYNELDISNNHIIIPCANLNPSCHHLLNADFFKQLPPESLIINAARGQLINQFDLINYLSINPKSYAFLDVYEKEPQSFEIFKNLNNIFTTSHIAGVYNGLDNAIIKFEEQIISSFLENYNELQSFNNQYENILMQNRIINEMLI